MIFPPLRPFLIVCLIILDILVAQNIVLAKTTQRYTLGIKIDGLAIKSIPSPTVSPTSSPTPSLTPSPTPIPSPTPTFIPVTTKQPTQATTTTISGGSLLDQVNAFRASKGLPAVQSDSNTCSFASTRAQEISGNFSHDGFNNRIAAHTLPYPSYHEVTENIAMNSDSTQIVNMWINSPGHNENMQKDTPYVCIRNFGSYYAYEGWRP